MPMQGKSVMELGEIPTERQGRSPSRSLLRRGRAERLEAAMRPIWFIDLPLFFLQCALRRPGPPLLASVKLSYRCNLRCRACPFHLRAGTEGDSMSWEQAVRALSIIRRMGTRIVAFEGGEPFLWRDGDRTLRDLVLHARRLFLRVAVTTNGTFPLDCPSDVLWVSVDGTKAVHDRLRSGSFDRVMAHLLASRHPRLRVHITLNRENWRDLEYLLARLRAIPSVGGVTLQFFYPYHRGEEPLALDPAERRETVALALGLRRRYGILNSPESLRAMTDNHWVCRDDVLVNVDPDGAITRGCYVRSRGEVRCPDCGFTPVAEASRALSLRPGSLFAGWRCYFG